MTTFNTRRKDFKVLTTRQYIKQREKDPKSVAGAKFIAPALGSKKFGFFKVRREVPEYDVLGAR